MDVEKVVKSISFERFEPYVKRTDTDEEALSLYWENIEESKKFYPILSVLEVILRNKINESCIIHFKNENWLLENLPPELSKQVKEIKDKLKKSKKEITNSRVLAELNFGFWTILFNRKYAKIFWKPLHRIFINTPKTNRKRTDISSKLNHIRTFRNRIYHYEPIIWNKEVLNQKREDILQLIYWLDTDTVEWLSTVDKSL